MAGSQFPFPSDVPMPFVHKTLLGWINDPSTHPRRGERWPMIAMDQQTLDDYRELGQVMRDWGYDGITIWGLHVGHSWPCDLDSAIAHQRDLRDRLLSGLREKGMRVIYGMGLYGWGFEEIIATHPEVARDEGRRAWGSVVPDNGVVMCLNRPQAAAWMERILNQLIDQCNVAGFGFQPGDLGRCFCRECRALGDAEYFTRVVTASVDQVRARLPKAIVSVSGWGMDFGTESDWPHLITMAQHLDSIVDVTDQSARQGGDYRQRLIRSLPCAWGSLGGTVLVPPQRWDRDRWFLAHARLTGERIRQLDADGGRAFEFFAGPLANPQYAIMTRFVGRMLNHPQDTVEQVLTVVVQDLFAPTTTATTEGLVEWLLAVEAAYFTRIAPAWGEFDFEPLHGEQAGPPIYLQDRMDPASRASFGFELERLRITLETISSDCRHRSWCDIIDRCLGNMLIDLGPGITAPRA